MFGHQLQNDGGDEGLGNAADMETVDAPHRGIRGQVAIPGADGDGDIGGHAAEACPVEHP